MLGKIFDKLLHEDENEIDKQINQLETKKRIGQDPNVNKINLKDFLLPIIIFILALIPRIIFMYANDPQNAGPDWYGDVYHHWQVAYLSKEIGFHQGFLRLWDLKGMEYFWGLLHPLVLSFLFFVFNSSDIIISRFLSIIMGSGIATLMFVLVRRYFNLSTAIVASLWVIFFPVMLYTDSLGMQDQIALFLLLLGVFFWPKKPFLAGTVMAIAGMGRAEFWIFGLGLVLGIFIMTKKFEKGLIALSGWFIISLFYMKYLLDKTGNPIYPVWWNYLGNVVGEWQFVKDLSIDAIIGKRIFQGIFAIGFIGFIVTLVKKPKAWMLFLLGFVSLIFNGFIFGFSAYIYGWIDRYYVDRLLNLPYTFLGFFLSIFFVYFLGERFKFWKKLKIGVIVMFFFLGFSQLVYWPFIFKYFKEAQDGWSYYNNMAAFIAQYYEGGKVLIVEDKAPMTYCLVQFNGIEGRNIVSQMFDPYYYMKEDPYDNWAENRKIILDWLDKEDIKLMAFFGGRKRYVKLIENEPDRFILADFKKNWNLYIYKYIK